MAPLLFWIRKEMGLDENILSPSAAVNIRNHPLFTNADKLTYGIWEGIFQPKE
jgi:hypothetical protein